MSRPDDTAGTGARTPDDGCSCGERCAAWPYCRGEKVVWPRLDLSVRLKNAAALETTIAWAIDSSLYADVRTDGRSALTALVAAVREAEARNERLTENARHFAERVGTLEETVASIWLAVGDPRGDQTLSEVVASLAERAREAEAQRDEAERIIQAMVAYSRHQHFYLPPRALRENYELGRHNDPDGGITFYARALAAVSGEAPNADALADEILSDLIDLGITSATVVERSGEAPNDE